ncbi:MAG: hypothetical protein ACE360_06130 [Hyphomicrobiales bacterium]
MAEQHNCDERGQFPEEGLFAANGHHRHRIGIGCGDRHRDQRHHTRATVADFGPQACQKRPAAIKIDKSGKPREHITVAWKIQRFPNTKPALDHWGESQNRHRGDKRYPEPLTVIGDHCPVVMTTMGRMAVMCIDFLPFVMSMMVA